MTSRLATRLTLVELFGVPGAGKSTVAAAAGEGTGLLSRADLSRSWSRCSWATKLANGGRAVMNYQMLAAAVGLSRKTLLNSPESLLRLARLVVKSQWLRSQRGGILLDQGLLQELWSIHYASGSFDPDPKRLRPLIRAIYGELEPCIVFIDVDEQTAASRIAGRAGGDSRLDGLPEAELAAGIVRAAELSRAILRAAQAAGMRTQVIDGAVPVEQVVVELRSVLRQVPLVDVDFAAPPKRKSIVTLDRAESLASDLAMRVRASGEQFELVLGIAAGGTHPAFHVAQVLGLPLRTIRIERGTTRLKRRLEFARKALSLRPLRKPLRRLGRFVDRRLSGARLTGGRLGEVRGKRVLLVDDCIDSGASAALARSLVLQAGAADVRIAVLCWTTKYDSLRLNAVAPDYFLGRVLPSYPWSADNPEFADFKGWLRQRSGELR